MGIMVGGNSATPFTVSSSAATSQTDSSAATRLKELRLGQGELNEFAAHLSKLRDLLARLDKVSIRTVAEPSHSPASVYSPPSLGLDFGASDDTAAIGSVAALSAVSSGSFEINGVSIAVDVGADSLADLVDRINASGAGATAQLHQGINGLVLTADDSGETLELGDGTSGLFSALEMGPGTHEAPTLPARSFTRPDAVRRILRDMGKELDAVFGGDFEKLDADLLKGARDDLETAIRDAMVPILGDSTADRLSSRLGLDFNFTEGAREVFTLRNHTFTRALDDRFEALADFLFREGKGTESSGLVPTLKAKLDDIAGSLVQNLADSLTQGALADVSA